MLSTVDGQDDDVLVGCAEVHGVRKPIEDGPPNFSSHESKLHRVVDDAFDRFVEACAELGTEPRSPTFVSVSRLECFRFRLGSKADPTIHSRSSSFRRTSSHGMAESGR